MNTVNPILDLRALMSNINFGLLVEFAPENHGLNSEIRGREFIKLTSTDPTKPFEIYLRKTDHEGKELTRWLAHPHPDKSGECLTIAIPLSYFFVKNILSLMPQKNQDELLGRDGTNDLRHHQQDNAPALGLKPGMLINANLQSALRGEFLQKPVDHDNDDDDDDFLSIDDLLGNVGSIFTSQPADPGDDDDLIGVIVD